MECIEIWMKVFTKYSFAVLSMAATICLVMPKSCWAIDPAFACGGEVENRVWSMWDSNVKTTISERFIKDRLLTHGDVYSLYDFQTYSHNLVAMAKRCNRTSRLQEIARLIDNAYGQLEPVNPNSHSRRWVCRGGSTCTEKNKLLNNEVENSSLQFLGVASSVANALATSNARLDSDDKLFVNNTVQIVVEHLLRWSDQKSLNAIHKARKAGIKDVKTASTALFFTDRHLWLISVYSELAGILNSPAISKTPQIAPADKARLTAHLNELLQFFHARLSIRFTENSRLGETELADLDRGYWRLFPENAYAGYESADSPVKCAHSGEHDDKFSIQVRVKTDNVPKRQDSGWDISHARRLVHALDSLERNRQSLIKIFQIRDKLLPRENTMNAYANTLVGVVWNGSDTAPLFSNYISGANGWYRVAYDNGTGQCREGTPPYGLTDAVPTGGYLSWSRYNAKIGALGKRLYNLSLSTTPQDYSFVSKYYSQLRSPLGGIMFLPSLVGVSIK